MVRSTGKEERWGWTSNVGGGDFFRWFDAAGKRLAHTAMRTTYLRQGPCLTEVTYAGRIGKGMTHSMSVSLARTDDLVRGVYQLQLYVKEPADFSRFVIFQIGADTYSDTAERKLALGNESGLLKEWDTQWGGNTYRTARMCGPHPVDFAARSRAACRSKARRMGESRHHHPLMESATGRQRRRAFRRRARAHSPQIRHLHARPRATAWRHAA